MTEERTPYRTVTEELMARERTRFDITLGQLERSRLALHAQLKTAIAERDAYRQALEELQAAVARALAPAPTPDAHNERGWAQADAWRDVVKRRVVDACAAALEDLPDLGAVR